MLDPTPHTPNLLDFQILAFSSRLSKKTQGKVLGKPCRCFPWCFCFLGVFLAAKFPLYFFECFLLILQGVFKGSQGETNPRCFLEVFLGVFEKIKEKKDREHTYGRDKQDFERGWGSDLVKLKFRTHRIGANPEKSDLVNFQGPDRRNFSELCVLLFFFLGKTDKMLPKSRFSKPIFGHSAGSTELDRPYCKRF